MPRTRPPRRSSVCGLSPGRAGFLLGVALARSPGTVGERNEWVGMGRASSGERGFCAVPAAGLRPPAIPISGRAAGRRGREIQSPPLAEQCAFRAPASGGLPSRGAPAAHPPRLRPESHGEEGPDPERRVRAGRVRGGQTQSRAPRGPSPAFPSRLGSAGRGAGRAREERGEESGLRRRPRHSSAPAARRLRPGPSAAEDADGDPHRHRGCAGGSSCGRGLRDHGGQGGRRQRRGAPR